MENIDDDCGRGSIRSKLLWLTSSMAISALCPPGNSSRLLLGLMFSTGEVVRNLAQVLGFRFEGQGFSVGSIST